MSLLRDVLGAATPADLHVNYRYMLAWAGTTAARIAGARILDFGCGDGRVVRAARAAGWDVVGADVFYGGSDARREAEAAGLLGTSVREIQDGRLDFPDGAFDLILSNQVIEHVEALGPTLGELARVLKPGGTLVCLFPTREVVREAHCGVPFLHWMDRGAERAAWAARWHWAGNSHDREKRTPEDWARTAVDWMDRYVRYRRRSELLREFGRRFRVTSMEEHYLAFRLRQKRGLGRLWPVLGIPWAAAAGRLICRRFNGVVWRARRIV